MSYYGDFKAGQTVRARFNTTNASGVPTTLTSGSVVVLKDGSVVTPSGGVTFVVDADTVTGFHRVTIDTSVDATTFAAGSDYAVRLGGTSAVGSTSVVGAIVGEFSIANRASVPQTGDAYARLGTPAGASIAADIATRSTYAGGDTAGTTTLVGRLTSTRATNLDNLDQAVSTRLATTAYTAPDTSKTGYKLAADGLDAVTVESGLNMRQAQSIVASMAAGVLAGAATTSVTIAAAGVPSTNRIAATVDTSGNRTSVTLNPPA